MKRRQFLRYAIFTTAFVGTTLHYFSFPAIARQHQWDKTLLLLELKGGNDGLNTVIPYADKNYSEMRPTLSISPDHVIKTTSNLGFNRAFQPLMPMLDANEMAVVLGVGYPTPNLSHFRGIDIWNTASDSNEVLSDGWISRLFLESPPDSMFVSDGINLADNIAGAIEGNQSKILTLETDPNNFINSAARLHTTNSAADNSAMSHILKQRQDMKQAAQKLAATNIRNVHEVSAFTDTKLGNQFQTAARLLIAGVRVPVLKLTIDKFDTHGNQEPLHGQLLSEIASNIAVFAQAMKKHNLWNNVLVMTYSEFGRRPAQNNSAGTDHGTAAPQFLFGGQVKGGFHGEQPPLNDLDNGNLKHRVHFRELYASVARQWWGLDASFIKERPLDLIG